MRTSAEKINEAWLKFQAAPRYVFYRREMENEGRVDKAPTFTEKLKKCKNIVIFKTQRELFQPIFTSFFVDCSS